VTIAILKKSQFNRYLLFALIPFALFSLVIFSFNLNKPFNLDEADPFALAAHSVLEDAKIFSTNHYLGLCHPPLYIYTLAATFKIFGETTAIARGLGLFYYCLTFILLLLICKELFPPKQFHFIALIAGSLYLINPLLIQYSLLIDIDGGLLVLLMVLFCYFFIRFDKLPMSPGRILCLGFLFGLTLLAKFVTSPLIIPAIFLYYILRRSPKQAFLYSLGILLIGTASFWSIWYLYCRIFDTPLLYPINNNLSRLNQGGFLLTQQKIIQIKYSLLYSIWWVSPAFAGLMIMSTLSRVRIFIKRKLVESIDFFLILALLVWFFYFIFAPRQAMMKYQTILYPLFIIIIAHFIYNVSIKDREMKRNERTLIVTLGLGVFVYYLLYLPDMLLWLPTGEVVVFGLYLAPFLIFPFIFYFFCTKRNLFFSLALSLFLLTIATELSQNIRQTADYTTTNSWFNYGETGEAQAIAYLNENLPPDGVAIVRKDIGYYLKANPRGSSTRVWIYNDIFRLSQAEARRKFAAVMQEYNVQYVQLDTSCSIKDGYKIIKPYFTLDKQFGNFFVFKKN